ncbi:hypothetical protein K443DRAFT_99264 [Laccaria amethystina LaAM-08-1]|uniref:J domain-containing protein n=1 Tax=Laccaria amethystina LaAM-08-1 TaxID=1095629 RepID=A0A0C9XTQ0_9AGAR|nr:hypothetical protein K443DRAFT_99264 [Laccaria amethystina LaAM-08-1]
MATYEYDEAGVMAAYFLITFLALVLVPLTISSLSRKSEKVSPGCQCSSCTDHFKHISRNERGLLLSLSRRTYFIIAGWSIFGLLCYWVAGLKTESKVYNPFEILDISSELSIKEIKSHFKKLSRMYHPDKVKASANQTLEDIQNKFVELTKAYKSLTDDTIRENWLKYNHPDGPQPTSYGIALPKWFVEGKNNIWVLGAYGIVFGGALPALVGRWWFGNRQKTKDGINAQSAAAFFKSLKEESTIEEVVGTLGKAYQWEFAATKEKGGSELDTLEKAVAKSGGTRWAEVQKLAQDFDGKLHETRRKALVLLYAHLLRLKITDSGLKKDQTQLLLQSPLLLNALLNASVSRNWLAPTLSVMRLQACLTQAVPPDASPRAWLTQLPGIEKQDLVQLSSKTKEMVDLLRVLEKKGDDRVPEVKKAMEKWGRVEMVDASFKGTSLLSSSFCSTVIGERVVAPSSIIFLVVKLRISPPGLSTETKELSVDETKRIVKLNDTKDEEFLTSRAEAEDISPAGANDNGWAHAPFWPVGRKPSWWVVLGDDKSNRIVVPPFKITDIPFSNANSDRDYRSYKIQFQGPPTTGLFTWRVYLVSDTFVGEEVVKDITLKIEDPPVVNDQQSDDEISEPDEDSLAGQMAAMRGGKVKKRKDDEEDSDEESGTDDDDKDSDSSSDSDSD